MEDIIARVVAKVVEILSVRLVVAASARAWQVIQSRNKPMMKPVAEREFLTSGEVAKLVGISRQHVTRLYEQGRLPPAPRHGRTRLIPAADLEKIKAAAREAGYMEE